MLLIRLGKIFVFSGLVLLMLQIIINIFMFKDGTYWNRFYHADRNSIDFIVYGNSHAQCTIDTSVLWDEYGIANFLLAAPSQDIDGTYRTIKESLKTQKPKAILVELYSVVWEHELGNGEDTLYRNAVGMKWSKDYLDYINYIVDSSDLDNKWKYWAYWKVPLLHSRYRELEKKDLKRSI